MDTAIDIAHNTKTVAPDSPVKTAASQKRAQLLRRIPVMLVGAALLGGGVLVGSVGSRLTQDTAVMTVNGEPIRQNEFRHRLELAYGVPVLRQMTQEAIAIQFAAKMGVLPTTQEIDAKYAEMSKQTDFAKTLASSRQTPEDIKHGILCDLAQQAVVNKGVTVSDADIQNFYKQNTAPKNPNARYYQPNAVQIAVVISDKENDIKKALHDLATGVAFVNVAKAYSKDKSAANGGVLPPVRAGQTDPKKFPGLDKQLLALKVGQQIDDIKVAGAYCIIRCVGVSTEATVPFEKVKAECRQGAMLTRGMQTNGRTMQTSLTDFQKIAEIKVLSPQFQDSASTK